jgi:hypothetical protein
MNLSLLFSIVQAGLLVQIVLGSDSALIEYLLRTDDASGSDDELFVTAVVIQEPDCSNFSVCNSTQEVDKDFTFMNTHWPFFRGVELLLMLRRGCHFNVESLDNWGNVLDALVHNEVFNQTDRNGALAIVSVRNVDGL